MITYQSSPSTWTFSQALAHIGLEIIFLNSIDKPLRDRSYDYRACHWVQSSMTPSRFFLSNVCCVIGNLSRRFTKMCWSAVSLQSCLFNVSQWVCNLMQTHAIPYSIVGFMHAFRVRICTCLSRSRENKCPNYVPFGRKIICPYWYTHEDIRKLEGNNSLECCHEVRLGRQNVPTKKVHSGKERKMYIRACKLYDLQVSGPLCPSLYFGSLWRRVNARNVRLLTLYGG